jgi:hypothetical protein
MMDEYQRRSMGPDLAAGTYSPRWLIRGFEDGYARDVLLLLWIDRIHNECCR